MQTKSPYNNIIPGHIHSCQIGGSGNKKSLFKTGFFIVEKLFFYLAFVFAISLTAGAVTGATAAALSAAGGGGTSFN